MFGNRTHLQILIQNLVNATTEFPYKKSVSLEAFYSDGYVISEVHKSQIDNCLATYPEMLYLCDIPNSDEDRANSALVYACRINTNGHGWSVSFAYYSLTSVVAYLFDLGAGIGFKDKLINLDLNQLPTQLLIGASDEFIQLHNTEISKHVLHSCDLLPLYRKNLLTQQDIKRLTTQAEMGLRHGNFDDEIKSELISIKRMCVVLHLLDDDSIKVYSQFNMELLIMILQGMHQLVEMGMPAEMTRLMLCHLTGLTEAQLDQMRYLLIEQHAEAFPKLPKRL